MQPSYKAILFDKDGTLIDLEGHWLQDIVALIQGLSPDHYQQITGVIGLDIEKMQILPFSPLAQCSFQEVAAILSEQMPEHSPDTLFQHLLAIGNNSRHAPTPTTDAIAVLAQLHKADFLIGIISNDCTAGIEKTIDDLGICDYVCYVAGSDSGHGPKPNAGMISQFCSEFDIDPQQVVMVGDSPADMQTAQMGKCGLSVGIHPDQNNPTLQFYTPHIFADLRPLPELLQALNNR